MFGKKGQKRIEAQPVCIAGLGGMGSQVAQGLAYLGVKTFSLIDHDHLEETNLNRVVGAYPGDDGRLKVDVAKDLILKINPKANVITIPKNLRTREAMERMIKCPVIFGCVDHDGPRLVLTDLAAAYNITLIDAASEIFPEKKDQPFDFGGRVVVARPGHFCLFCANQLDRELAKEDLETKEVRALRRKHGYGLGKNEPAPAVIALNGVVANLAVMEFLAMTTGIREPEHHLTYRGMRGIVTKSTDKRKPNCFTCGYLCGQRDEANIWRYLLESAPRTRRIKGLL